MPNKIIGKRRAVIVNTAHESGMMKAQIRLMHEWDDMPDRALPWAEYLLPIGAGFIPTIAGDMVWVEFPYDGDSRRPMIVGAAQDWAGGIPNVPPEASGQAGQFIPPDVPDAPPAPQLNPTKDAVLNRNGLLEVRSEGGGFAITRTSDGTTIGMNESGQAYMISKADLFLNAGGKVTIVAGNQLDIKAGGNMSFSTSGTISFKGGQIAFIKG
ncbi:baseplate protein [Serratia silvae]